MLFTSEVQLIFAFKIMYLLKNQFFKDFGRTSEVRHWPVIFNFDFIALLKNLDFPLLWDFLVRQIELKSNSMGGSSVSRASSSIQTGIGSNPSHFLFFRSAIQTLTLLGVIKFIFWTIILHLPLQTPLTSIIALLMLSLTLPEKCFANAFAKSGGSIGVPLRVRFGGITTYWLKSRAALTAFFRFCLEPVTRLLTLVTFPKEKLTFNILPNFH